MGNGPAGMMPVSTADGGMNNGGMAMTTRPAMSMGNMQPMRQPMMCMPSQAGNQMGNGPPNRMMMFNPRQPNMLGNPRMAAAGIPPNVRMTQQQVQQQQVSAGQRFQS